MKSTFRHVGSAMFAALVLVALSLNSAYAAKPDNPGGGNGGGGGGGGGGNSVGQNGGGVIYLRYYGELYTMKDDGSDMTVVPGFPDLWSAENDTVPSRQLHAGQRWFPVWNGQELLGVSDAGVASAAVSLQNDPLVEGWGANWRIGDEAIAWTGRRRDATGAVVEGGIYSTPVTFDGAGNLASAGPTELFLSFPLVDGFNGTLTPDVRTFDWSPDGSQIVYDTYSDETVIADVLSGTIDTVIADASSPRWSPAGDKLMVGRDHGGRRAVGVINLDGSGFKVIESSGISWDSVPGVWSPTGSHLTFLHQDNLLSDSYIGRAKANGSGKQQLTVSTVANAIYALQPLGWRKAPVAASAVPEPQAAALAVAALSLLLGLRQKHVAAVRREPPGNGDA